MTADLLLSQRKLEDERQAVENLGRELRKTRQQVEEERSKRQEAEDGKAKLGSEIEALRGEAGPSRAREMRIEEENYYIVYASRISLNYILS